MLLVPPKIEKELSRRNHDYVSHRVFNLLSSEIKNLSYKQLRNNKNRLLRSFLIDLSDEIVSTIFQPQAT